MSNTYVLSGEGLKSCLELEPHKYNRILYGCSIKCAKEKENSFHLSSIYNLPKDGPKAILGSGEYHVPKNLDMCTEILGLENGVASNFSNGSPAASVFEDRTSYNDCSVLDEEIKIIQQQKKRSLRSPTSSFPPTLTTLRGGNGLRLEKKRVDGRLLLLRSTPHIIEVERKDGRLILHSNFRANNASNFIMVKKQQP